MINISLIISNLPEIQKATGNKSPKPTIKHCLQVIQQSAGVPTVADLRRIKYNPKDYEFTTGALDMFLEGEVYRVTRDIIQALPKIDPATMSHEQRMEIFSTVENQVLNAAYRMLGKIYPGNVSGRGSEPIRFEQSIFEGYLLDKLDEFNHTGWRKLYA